MTRGQNNQNLQRVSRARKGYVPQDYADALHASKGMVALAAKTLGVTTAAAESMLRTHPDLKQIVLDYREQHIDTAESMLRDAVAKKQAWAICFTLKTIGHTRGYVERHEWHGESDTKLTRETVVTVRTEQLLDTARLLAGKSFSRLAQTATEDAN